MNNMKFLFIFILFILISCFNSNVKLNINKKSKIEKNVKDTDSDSIDHLDYNIPINEFVYLFFDKSFFVKTQNNSNNRQIVRQKIDIGNPDDYKAIVDWQENNGERYVRLKNLKTGKEYIVKEGDTRGEVILLERNLFFYKFKIGNQVIKVKR
jgi:hypothetical protein